MPRWDFENTAFEEAMTSAYGPETIRRAQALRATPAFQELVLRNSWVMDDAANDLANKIMRDRSIKQDFEMAIAHGIDAVEEPCAELSHFMQSATNLPAQIDLARVERGGAAYQKHMNPLTLALYILPILAMQGTAQGVSHSLVFTGQPQSKVDGKPLSLFEHYSSPEYLASGRFFMRSIETLNWTGSISAPGCASMYSPSFVEACRIRLVHGYVRNGLANRKSNWNFSPTMGWDEQELGVPLSAIDGLVILPSVLAAFSLAQRKMGVSITDEELEDIAHWAAFYSHLQGMPSELVLAGREDANIYTAAFYLSINADFKPEVTTATLYGLTNGKIITSALDSHPIWRSVASHTMAAIMNNLWGNSLCKTYGLPKAPVWAQVMIKGIEGVAKSANNLGGVVPQIQRWMQSATISWWQKNMPSLQNYANQRFAPVAQGGDFDRSGS